MNEILQVSPLPAGQNNAYSLWRYIVKLMRMRWIITFSQLRRANRRRKIGMIFLGILLLGGLGFVFWLTWFLLRFLKTPQFATYVGDASVFLDTIPVLIVAASFIAILMTSFGVLLQALYLSGDMDFLLSAPVPIRAVFVTKMLQAILPNFALILMFSLPVLFGLGAANGYNLLYYPLVILILAALALAAAGISALVVMGVVRIFPARRVAEVLAFVGAIFSMLCSQTGNFINASRYSGSDTPPQIGQSLGVLARFNTPWSPLAWAGRGLVDIGAGHWASGTFFVLITLLLSAAAFAVSLVTAERLYYTGWASVQVGTRRKRAPKAAAHPIEARQGGGVRDLLSAVPRFFERLIPAPVRAVVIKDFQVNRRDLRNLSQALTPMILGIVYAVMLLRGRGPTPTPEEMDMPETIGKVVVMISTYASLGISLFVGWVLLARLALMSFSQEGKSYWVLKSAPVSPRKLVAAKFLVAYLPSLVVSWAFLFAIALLQRAQIGVIAYSLPVIALTVAGATGINLAFGIKGANLHWTDPRQMSGGATGCLGAIASMIYLPISLALFFIPPVGAALLNLPLLVGNLVGLLLGGAFTIACAILPPASMLKRVNEIGEE